MIFVMNATKYLWKSCSSPIVATTIIVCLFMGISLLVECYSDWHTFIAHAVFVLGLLIIAGGIFLLYIGLSGTIFGKMGEKNATDCMGFGLALAVAGACVSHWSHPIGNNIVTASYGICIELPKAIWYFLCYGWS